MAPQAGPLTSRTAAAMSISTSTTRACTSAAMSAARERRQDVDFDGVTQRTVDIFDGEAVDEQRAHAQYPGQLRPVASLNRQKAPGNRIGVNDVFGYPRCGPGRSEVAHYDPCHRHAPQLARHCAHQCPDLESSRIEGRFLWSLSTRAGGVTVQLSHPTRRTSSCRSTRRRQQWC